MPTIRPVSDAVSWPLDEGVIGVVGVAPWATLDFLKALYAQVSASKDWHYPRVLCDINTKLPSRGRHIELGERDPSPFIAATITELAQQGATIAVVACNTAHIFHDRWATGAPIPVLNIVDATVDAMRASGGRKAALFASRSLYRHGLYQTALRSAGISVAELPDDDVEFVNTAIGEVKTTAQVSTASMIRFEHTLQELASRGVDGLVLACTELAGLETLARHHLPAVAESNRALASTALRGIRGHSNPS